MKNLICPLCSAPLIRNPRGVSCDNRHQFDRAKEGYFNLLPVQNKGSLEPGDAKQQLTARRVFLTQGFFAPLVTSMLDIIPQNINTLLDIGCGEGYFTKRLGEHCVNSEIYGIDIAKAGIRLAAKNAGERFTFAVASSYGLPLANASMDVITRIYAPSKDDQLLRVLRPEGKLIIVTPGHNHLLALRQKIYAQIKPHQPPQTPTGFNLVEVKEVEFDLAISDPHLISALLSMTPFSWRLNDTLRSGLISDGFNDRAHFQIGIYQRAGQVVG